MPVSSRVRYLNRDVLSHTREVYGTAGAEVIVIADHETVMIVENKKKERFAVHTDVLSMQPLEIPDEKPKATKQINKPAQVKKKSAPERQPNLF